MSRVKGLVARLRALLRPTTADRRTEEEFAFHLDMEIRRSRAEGHSHEEARRQALARFGRVDRYRDEMREARGARWVDHTAADVRFAFRVVRRSPGLALAMTVTLGVGIGMNGFTFGVADALLFRPIPARTPEQLVGVFPRDTRTGRIGNFAYDDFVDFRDKSAAFAGLAGVLGVPLNVVASGTASDVADIVWGEMVTENFFTVLDMQPAMGRFFSDRDGPPGANPDAVLSYSSWRERFKGDAAIVGRPIRVNGTDFTIRGVAPRGFKGMRTLGFWPEIWVPAGMHKTIVPGSTTLLVGRGRGWLTAVGRMREGWDLNRTHVAAGLFARRLEQQFPDSNRYRAVLVVPARSGFDNPEFVKPQVLVLSAALGIVASVVTLLIICANLANLQIARTVARSRELAIRLSLGCSKARLARQLLVETFVLALPGVALAAAIVRATPTVESLILPQMQFRVGMDVSANFRVALFTTVVGVAAVVLVGLIPVLRAGRASLAPLLAHGRWRRSRSHRYGFTLSGALVVSQLAMAVVLLAGGTLFTRSLLLVQASDVGFDVRDRLLMSVNIGLQGYDESKGRRFYDDVLARVRNRPEVVAASWVFPAPFDTYDRTVELYVEGADASHGSVRTEVSFVAEDFVDALGLRLIAGRDIELRDAERAPGTLVVSRALAARLWPRADPIGRRLRIGTSPGREVTVVGVVDDARFRSLGDVNPARAYLPLRQWYRDWETLVVYTRGDARTLLPRIRDAVTAADPGLPVFGVTAVDDAIASGQSSWRAAAAAAGFFGILAVLIAAIGLYAVVASSVHDRTQEIGIRLALGSTPRGVMCHVMASGIRLGAWGLAFGLAGALALARVMARLLFGVEPFDPLTFAIVPSALFVVVLAATYFPVRRAVRLDPIMTLRRD